MMHDRMHQSSQCLSAMINLDASCAQDLNNTLPALKGEQQALARSSSCISTASSDFEFNFSDQVLNDEPPASPKLATSTTFFLDWPTALGSSMEASDVQAHQYSADEHYHHTINGDRYPLQAGTATDHHIDAMNGSDSSDCILINHSERLQSMPLKPNRVQLKSLILDRRELEQLPPLFHGPPSHMKDSPCDNEDIVDDQRPSMSSSLGPCSPAHPSSSSASSSPELHSTKEGKKSRRWSFSLDFLKKSSPVKVHNYQQQHQQLHKALSVDDLRHDDFPVDSGIPRVASDSAQHLRCPAQSVRDSKHATGSWHGFLHYESPRHSTCSSTSTSSSSSTSIAGTANARERGPIKSGDVHVQRTKRSAGATACPPGSPLHYKTIATRSPSPTRRPVSPHAQHYLQHRAHADELRRRTPLPYRQQALLLSSCFFHFTPDTQVY